MRFLLTLTLLGVLAFLHPGPAQAQPPAHAAVAEFAGSWVGRSQPGSDRQRATTVVIEPLKGNAFRIEWESFEADRAGEIVRRGDRLVFRPSRTQGIWLADGKRGPFEMLAAWAFIADRSLVVSTAALRSDGRLERQLYRRTLTQDGMALAYQRFLDQDLDREIGAEFLRVKSLPPERPPPARGAAPPRSKNVSRG